MQSQISAVEIVKGGNKMKSKSWLVLTSLVAAVFILSLFTGIVAAQTPVEYEKAKEQYQAQKERFEKIKEKVDDAKQNFEDAREKFREARNKFKSGKDRISREELKNKTREYLERAIDYMIRHLETQKKRIENAENRGILPFNASNNIDKHIAQLEEIRVEVRQANTSDEFIKSARELEDIANKIRLETRYYVGILLNHKIDLFFAKADNISARMDASKFNDLLKEAKDNHRKTLDLYAGHNGFDSNGAVTNNSDARAFLQEANGLQEDTLKKLKSASRHLLGFFKDDRKLLGGKVVVGGTGRLEANGSGRAVIEGNVTVKLRGINGILMVSGNSNVTTDGIGTKEVLGNGNVKYQGFGSAEIKAKTQGESIKVEISGNNIDLTAEGKGYAVLNGNGTYRTEDNFTVSGEWKED